MINLCNKYRPRTHQTMEYYKSIIHNKISLVRVNSASMENGNTAYFARKTLLNKGNIRKKNKVEKNGDKTLLCRHLFYVQQHAGITIRSYFSKFIYHKGVHKTLPNCSFYRYCETKIRSTYWRSWFQKDKSLTLNLPIPLTAATERKWYLWTNLTSNILCEI